MAFAIPSVSQGERSFCVRKVQANAAIESPPGSETERSGNEMRELSPLEELHRPFLFLGRRQ